MAKEKIQCHDKKLDKPTYGGWNNIIDPEKILKKMSKDLLQKPIQRNKSVKLTNEQLNAENYFISADNK